MIKFFRRIRYDLVEKSKAGRYFRYAIGEIILVVIGILIALQINNWNTDRKNDAIKRMYYAQIIQDLEKDEAIIIGYHADIDSFFDRLKSYQETFKNNEIPLWEACTAIGRVFSDEADQGWNYEVNTNTITTLINTGDVKLIPGEIRNILLDFKYHQSGLSDYLKSQSTVISNGFSTTLKIYGGPDLATRINKQPILIKYYNEEKTALSLFLGLEELLHETSLLLKNGKERSKKLLRDIERIKEIINEELTK